MVNSLGLFGFGIAFIFLQSTLITIAQEKMPRLRGTAMSLASFNMFVGGALGTFINGKLMTTYGAPVIFLVASVLMLFVGLASSLWISGFERRKAERVTLNS